MASGFCKSYVWFHNHCSGTVDLHRLSGSLQNKAKNPEAFLPDVLSLDTATFRSLVTNFKLPPRFLETSSAVGPFFWWTQDHGNLRMYIIPPLLPPDEIENALV